MRRILAVLVSIGIYANTNCQVSYSESVPEGAAESIAYEKQLLDMLTLRPELSAFAKQRLGIVYFSRSVYPTALEWLQDAYSDKNATTKEKACARLYQYRVHKLTKSGQFEKISRSPSSFVSGCAPQELATQALVSEIIEHEGIGSFIDGRAYSLAEFIGVTKSEGLDVLAATLMQYRDSTDPAVRRQWKLAAMDWIKRYPAEAPTIHIHRAVIAAEQGVEKIPYARYAELFLAHPKYKNKWGINVIYGATQAAAKENKFRECLEHISEFEELEASLPADQKMGPEWEAPILQTKAICQTELGLTDDAIRSAREVRAKYPGTVSAKMIEKYGEKRLPMLSQLEVLVGWALAIGSIIGVLWFAFRPRRAKQG
jgi:hypothetical protein